MAGKNQVTYTIQLRDRMTGNLARMGVSVSALRAQLRSLSISGLKAAAVAMKNFAMVLSGVVYTAMLTVTFASIRMGREFVDAASMAEETRSKFSAVFKEIAGEAEDMAEAISEGLGRNQTEVMGFMARLQDTFVPMGIARDQAMDMSGALVSLSYDLASFNPEMGSAAEVMNSLTSAMIGSHEAAYKFGIIINDASLKQKMLSMGAKKVNGAFTEQDKAMARLQIIIESTGDAHGDLIRTQDSWFNSTEKIKSSIQRLREEMGEKLTEALEDSIKEMGGADKMISLVKTSFSILTGVLIGFVIPAVFKAIRSFASFIEALGGTDEAIRETNDALFTLADTVSLSFKIAHAAVLALKIAVRALVETFEKLQDIGRIVSSLYGLTIVKAFELTGDAAVSLLEALESIATFLGDTFSRAVSVMLAGLAALYDGISKAVKLASKFGLINKRLEGLGDLAASASEGLKTLSAAVEFIPGTTVFARLAADAEKMRNSLKPAKEEMNRLLDEASESLTSFSAGFADDMLDDARPMLRLFDEIREQSKEVGADYEAMADKIRAALDNMKDAELITPEQIDAVKALADQMDRLNPALGSAADNTDELGDESGETSKELTGFSKGVATFQQRVGSMDQQLARLAEDGLYAFSAGLSDALMSVVDGSKSAGEAFKEFAANFLMDITNMIVQTLVYRAVAGALGLTPAANGAVFQGGLGDLQAFANGGTVDGGLGRFMPVKGYATGGPIVNKPHVALIGEGKHNEAVVPLPDGRSIPVDMQGDSGTQVNINIEAVDAASVDQLLFQRKDTLRSIISSAIAESRSFRGAIARA